MQTQGLITALFLAGAAGSPLAQATDTGVDPQLAERGRYILTIGACHDCHTPGYPEADGKIPQDLWLTGNEIGFQGPWGTTYPVNLRLYVQKLSEQEWLVRTRQPMRPPMPWFNLRDMAEADLRAIYHYLRALGPTGEPAPSHAPPGVAVTTPYYDFTPRNLRTQALK